MSSIINAPVTDSPGVDSPGIETPDDDVVSTVGSHAGTIDLTSGEPPRWLRPTPTSGAADADAPARTSASPNTGSETKHYSLSIFYAIVMTVLVIVAIGLGAASLQKSNEALMLAEYNAEEADAMEMRLGNSVAQAQQVVYVPVPVPAPAIDTEIVTKDINVTEAVPLATTTPASASPTPKPTAPPTAKPITPAPTPLPTSKPISITPQPTNKPTTPQPTITHPLNPKWFQTTHDKYVAIAENEYNQEHHSHLLTGLFCVQHDLDLCPYEVYCPNGKGQLPYLGGPPKSSNWASLKENQWAAFKTPDVTAASSAAGGTWVQVGKIPTTDGGFDGNNHGVCWTWDEWENGGGGDIENVWNEEHRVWMLCCERAVE